MEWSFICFLLIATLFTCIHFKFHTTSNKIHAAITSGPVLLCTALCLGYGMKMERSPV